MQIYLIRHGIAAKKGTYADDTKRPLVEKGVVKTKKVAQRLLDKGITFNHLLSSPFVRAYQTAEILQEAGLCPYITTHEPLKQGGDIDVWIEWLKNHFNNEEQIALVGHEPDLTSWAEMLIYGVLKEKLILKKSGIIGLQLTENINPIGNCELFLFTAPKWFI